jgi:hypothetical protein
MTKSFLTELSEASVAIDGEMYPLDEFPYTYLDAVRERTGNSVPDMILEMQELGFTPGSAPDTLEAEVDGTLYTRADVDRVCKELVSDILDAAGDLFRQLNPALGDALGKALLMRLVQEGIVEGSSDVGEAE